MVALSQIALSNVLSIKRLGWGINQILMKLYAQCKQQQDIKKKSVEFIDAFQIIIKYWLILNEIETNIIDRGRVKWVIQCFRKSCISICHGL